MALNKKNTPIGVFDSGMGGLTVLRALQETLPNESFLYFGDTARLPYGTKSQAAIEQYALEITTLLLTYEIKCLIIACNTASSLALEPLKKAFPDLPIIGVLAPGAHAAVSASKNQHIALLGTEATIQSGAYQHHIHQLAPKAKIYPRSCALFVTLAEEGWGDTDIAVLTAKRYLASILAADPLPDVLLLGCTHFPALIPSLKKVLNPKIQIIDSAQVTAKITQLTLEKKGLITNSSNPKSQPAQFLVSNLPERFVRLGPLFLGRLIDPALVNLKLA